MELAPFSRDGVTLIELLVVIAIIGVAIALVIPAVQRVREAANRLACANNLKQLGLACQNYHDSHGSFPPGAMGPFVAPKYVQWKQHGLGTYLLPYLEQMPLANQYTPHASWFDPQNHTVVNTQLNVWQCPSARSNRVQDGQLQTVTPPPFEPFNGTAACGDYAGMSYVDSALANTGLIDFSTGAVDELGHYEGVFPVNCTRGLSDILDGSSSTILIGECAGRPQLWQGSREVPDKWLSGGAWASRNLLWCRGSTEDGSAFLGSCAINCTNDREVYSFHPGGANVVFADGTVRFLRATIPIRVFARLVTRAGGEIISAGDY
jgi:prepilin-type N-terminal cleavage/methylation domain-containing protein/prepilin-type processing-associated H-X9-DG protein